MTNASQADDELMRAEDPVAEGRAGADADEADDGFDIEHEGQVYRLPGALKGGFLRQADYTRKTQELAAHRRSLEAAAEAMAAHAQATDGALADRAHLAALDRQLAGFGAVDWQTLARNDPRRAEALWGQCQQTQALRDRYAACAAQHAQHSQIQVAHEAAARMAETGRTLAKEIDGWSPELAAKLVDYARSHGVTLAELHGQDDPRVWKILHRAFQADQTNARDGAAKTAAQAQAVRPAVTVSGSAAGGGGVRDELGTKEWMQRRNDALRKGRR